MTVLYGIKNCDTVKKARCWLDQQPVNYRFHDFREHGLTREQVDQWLAELGVEQLLNRRSATWKQLTDADKQKLLAGEAADLIVRYPTLIKRPLLDTGRSLFTGFKEADYARIFG